MTKLDLPDSIRKHQYSYSTFFFPSFAISQEPLIAFDHHWYFPVTLGRLDSRQPNHASASGIRSFMKFVLFYITA